MNEKLKFELLIGDCRKGNNFPDKIVNSNKNGLWLSRQ